MTQDTKPTKGGDKPASFTSQHLNMMVLDHLLDNSAAYLAEGTVVERFTTIADLLTGLCEQVARQAVANRQHLSPLKTFSSTIEPDPDLQPDDGTLYEMHFRIVEAVNNQVVADKVMTSKEVIETFGLDFVTANWGILGELTPRIIEQGDRKTWFSTCRYPVKGQALQQEAVSASTPKLAAQRMG